MSWASGTKLRLQMFSVALPILCVGFLIWMAQDAATHYASNSWPSVPGEVTDVVAKPWRDGNRVTKYFGRAVYVYVVDGNEYTSELTDLGPGEKRSTPEEALADVRKYRPGMKVDVFYDPSNPQIAVLEKGIPGIHGALILGLIVGVVIGSIASFFTIRGWLRLWRTESDRQQQFQRNREVLADDANPAASLGTQLGEFRPILANVAAGWILSILAIFAGLGLLAYAVWVFQMGREDKWTGTGVLSAIGLALTVGGGFLMRYSRSLSSMRIAVHEGGIRYAHGEAVEVILWRAIDSIHEANAREHPGCFVTTKIGKEYSFSENSIDDIARFCDLVRDYGRRAGVPFKINE